MRRGVYPQIVPVRDEFFGRLNDGLRSVSDEARRGEGVFKESWEIETAPKPSLQMKMERSEVNERSK